MALVVITVSLVALLSAVAPAHAQGTKTDVPQRFWLEVGGFRVDSATRLSFFGALGGPEDQIDFESDLDLPGTTTQGYIEAFWRPARRHQFSLNWQRVRRDSNRVTLDEQIEWGDIVFEVGADIQSTADSDFVSGAYRFALFKNEAFEIGPAVGVGYAWITATLRGEAEIGAPGGSEPTEIDSTSAEETITGDIGGYLYWWPGARWLVRGEFRYFALGLEQADAGITEGRASLTWYAWRNVGFSVQYLHTRFRYDRKRSTTGLDGTYRYEGFQFLVNAAF
jgi:hypothetical protein